MLVLITYILQLSHKVVCCRLVFLLMYSFAAVGLDAAHVADRASKTGYVEDSHVQRKAALKKVDEEILHLLQCTTPYTLATMYSPGACTAGISAAGTDNFCW